MQKVKTFTAMDCRKLQEMVNDFIQDGHVVEQVSYTTYVMGYNTHHNCMVLYRDPYDGRYHDESLLNRPTAEEIDVRR